jgi:hypothetical protein
LIHITLSIFTLVVTRLTGINVGRVVEACLALSWIHVVLIYACVGKINVPLIRVKARIWITDTNLRGIEACLALLLIHIVLIYA